MSNGAPTTSNGNSNSSNGQDANSMIKPIDQINFDDLNVPVKEEKKEPEFKEATKFNFTEKIDVKVVSTGTGKSKRVNKIQKVDFDFNFDNFNEVNFSSFGGQNGNNNNNGNGAVTEPNFDDEFGGSNNNSSNKKKKNKYEDEEEESSYGKLKISKEEINKKFANKKAISSEDYANLEGNPSQTNAYKNKLSGMKYSQAISSSDMYGEPEEGKN